MPRIFPVGTLALICLLGALSGPASASCPASYTKILSATSNVCDGGELCDASQTTCDPTQGCRVRKVSGSLPSTVATNVCPLDAIDITNESMVTTTLSSGEVKKYCLKVTSPFSEQRFKSVQAPQSVNGVTQTKCSRWSMITAPPATSGLQSKSGVDVTFNAAEGSSLPYGAWVVTLTGNPPADPCGQNRVTLTRSTKSGALGTAPRGSPSQLCVAPTRDLNFFRVTTTDRSTDGCGTLQLKVTDQSTGVVRTLNQTGTNTVQIQGATAASRLRGPFLIEVAPGSGPTPSSDEVCNSNYLYNLTWTADELPDSVPTPSGAAGDCPTGSTLLTENFSLPSQPGEVWSAGARFNMEAQQTVTLCWARDQWSAGFDVDDGFLGSGTARYRVQIQPPPGSESGTQTTSFGARHSSYVTQRTAAGPAVFTVQNADGASGEFFLRVEDCVEVAPPGPTSTARPSATPGPTVNASCPAGYEPLNETYKESVAGSTRYDGGAFHNGAAGRTFHFCILPETGTVDDNGDETGVSQHPRGGTSSAMSVRVLGRTENFRAKATLTYPPSMGSITDARTTSSGQHIFARIENVPNSEPFLLDVPIDVTGLFIVAWSAGGGRAGTGGPTPRPGDSFDPLLGIPAAPGSYIDNGFSSFFTSTFLSVSRVPIFATLFYYGWTGASSEISQMADPPAQYPGITSSNFGYASDSWITEQLNAMMAADIDLALVEYKGWPGNAPQNTVANGGLQNVVDVWKGAKDDGFPVPKIGMLLTGQIFVETASNPFHRVLNLTSEADQKYLVGVVRDFWSQLPPGLWGQIDHRPVIVLGPPGPSRVNTAAIDRLRRYFKLYFGTKDPYIIADTTSWGSVTSAVDATTTWYASLNGPSFGEKVIQIGPSFDDSKVIGPTRGFRARDNGATYSNDWGLVLPRLSDGKVDFVILETWNQYQQGNIIGPGYAFGSKYVDLTFSKIGQASGTLPGATFVSQTLPVFSSNQMVVGAKGTAQITFKNSGSTSWSLASGFYLGSQNPQDNLTWGLKRVSLGDDVVPPGENHTFSFEITAPSTAGTYNFQWKMVREGSSWFGETSTNVAVNVVAPTPTPLFTATPGPTQSPEPTTITPTPSPIPTPVESTEFPPGPIETPFAGCPEGYTTLQPPFGVPGICYEQGRPDRPLKTPAAGRCPSGYFVDLTPFGAFCRPLPTPTPR